MFETPPSRKLEVAAPLLPQGSNRSGRWLRETTPVRLDLSHSAWSDIFFLGMDFPEGARVLNLSVDLAVRGRDEKPAPPIQAFVRVIDEPVLRLTSIDLGARATLEDTAEVFDFARDYLGLVKAAVIASGIIPPALESSPQPCSAVLEPLVGPGRGLEIVSHVANIPKGSRLAVSTNLLASLIACCMRATGQTENLEGPLTDEERRVIVGRAILGEWLGGSGGGWQDSGGLWPSLKLIEGKTASVDDAEFGTSRGCLLPTHRLLPWTQSLEELSRSLVLVYGGMAQNVGPILEMVTEKYLLRSRNAWFARQRASEIFEQILEAVDASSTRRVGELTTSNFEGPLQTIIPWATNLYTESLIRAAKAWFGDDYWGFLMLGGMSGGGMGFFINPERADARDQLQLIAQETKQALEDALPFAMNPVVYDFTINDQGSVADFDAEDPAGLSQMWASREPVATVQNPQTPEDSLDVWLARHGFDRALHEQIRDQLKSGALGLDKNRLDESVRIEDVDDSDLVDATAANDDLADFGRDALRRGEVGVVTLAAGLGTRWTQGAGVVKALHPFCPLAGRHRRFLEVHLAKTRRTQREFGIEIPHIVTTSYLTHGPIETYLSDGQNRDVNVMLSPGKSIGLRMVPGERDLRFYWNERAHQVLDEQQQKVRESLQEALVRWAQETGEWGDYRDNLPEQCLHPVGHWFEVPNLMRNGVLQTCLRVQPQLKYLLLHNIDTVGATLDPLLLGHHLDTGADLTFEVIPKHLDDQGGGLAKIDGQPRLIEGLALPDESVEFRLRYYNSMTTWITIDGLLQAFELTRDDLDDTEKVDTAIREFAVGMPTYVTLKEVKKRWGHGHEDVFPVLQFEKLWGDMTARSELQSRFLRILRHRGQQLKDPAQLDAWVRDGSAAWVETVADWI